MATRPIAAGFPGIGSLALFVDVLRLGSLSRAAEAQLISQPAATARIRQLERSLGLRLLERGPTGSTPTEAGTVVAGWANVLLSDAEAMWLAIESLNGPSSGQLRLASSYTIAEYLVPAWLAAFHQRHPDVSTSLDVDNSSRVADAVRDHRADLGLVESPEVPRGLRSAVVGHDELVLVVQPGHALSRRRRPLPAAFLADLGLVLREKGSGTRSALDQALGTAGLPPPEARVELGSSSAVKAAVASGMGPSVLSRLAVRSELEAGSLVQVEMAGVDLRRELRAVWAAQPPLPEAASTLLRQLRAQPAGRSR
ncbi:MAG: LysR family transcriptional regulator [Acidimicrobiales bacterium]